MWLKTRLQTPTEKQVWYNDTHLKKIRLDKKQNVLDEIQFLIKICT